MRTPEEKRLAEAFLALVARALRRADQKNRPTAKVDVRIVR